MNRNEENRRAKNKESDQVRDMSVEPLSKFSLSMSSDEGMKELIGSLDKQTVHRASDQKQTHISFRTLVESAEDLIFRANAQGDLIYANPVTCDVLGYSSEELMTKNYLELVEDEYGERLKQVCRGILERREDRFYIETLLRTNEDRLLWVGVNATIKYDTANKPLYVSGVARDITDLKLADSRLSNLIVSLQSAVLVEDSSRKLVVVNDEFMSLFNIPGSPDQVVGLDCSLAAEFSKDLILDGEAFVNRINMILEDGRPVQNEVVLMKSGLVLERDYVPIFTDGHFTGHLWNYRDITAREEDKRKLELSNKMLDKNLQQQQLLADISMDLLNDDISFDHKVNKILKRIGEFLDVSRVYIFEDDAKGLCTSNTYEWCNRGIQPQIDELQEVPYDSIPYWPKTLSSEGMIFSEDISKLPEEVQDILGPQGIKSILVFPLLIRGSIMGFIGFDECVYIRRWDQSNVQLLRTISNLIAREYERRADHRALTLSEERYRGIIANMNLGLVEVDLNDRIRYVNHAFEVMSGYQNDELAGQQAAELFLKGHSRDIIANKHEARRGGISDTYELEVMHKSGDKRWWLISGGPLRDMAGEIVGSIGIHLDITDRKRLESELKEARIDAELSSKHKEQFLANMSHEIRTPLNGVVGMIRELRRTGLRKEQSLYLDLMKKAADNLLVIINDILDISKVQAGKLELESKPFEFRAVLNQAVEVLRPKCEEKGLSLTMEVADDIAQCFVGDEYRINQILLNLIGNAIKFTDKGGVDISVRRRQNQVDQELLEICIRDTGIGISNEFKARLFEQFSQEDRGDERRYGGTGLGLSITKQLVELMDGSIHLESEEGKGSVFTIKLPLVVDQNGLTQTQESIDHLHLEHLKDKRVLLAEDNEMNQAVIQILLLNFGVEVVCVGNGQEAVDALKSEMFDVVLMDIQMPVMDGVSATKKIRNDLSLNVPIIALTAKALKGDDIRLKKAGLNAYVPKPFEEYELLSEMIRALEEA